MVLYVASRARIRSPQLPSWRLCVTISSIKVSDRLYLRTCQWYVGATMCCIYERRPMRMKRCNSSVSALSTAEGDEPVGCMGLFDQHTQL